MFRPPPMRMALPALVILAACVQAEQDIAAMREPDLMSLTAIAPPGAAPDTCWGRSAVPAVIETVTEQVLIQPAEVLADGTVRQPAVYRTETRQMIVRERKETWFETPCAAQLTPDFIASLQRALSARALFRGEPTGEMDSRTRAAIRRYQAPQGLDSGILSLAAARRLGLVVRRDQSPPPDISVTRLPD